MKITAAVTLASFLISLVIAQPVSAAARHAGNLRPIEASEAEGSAGGLGQDLQTAGMGAAVNPVTGNSIGAYTQVLKQKPVLLDVDVVKDMVRKAGWTLGSLTEKERDTNMDPPEKVALDPSKPVVVLLGAGSGRRMQLPEDNPNYGLPKFLITLDAGDGVRRAFNSLIFEAIGDAGMQTVVVLPGRQDFNEIISKVCAGMAAVTQQYPLGTAHATVQAERLLRDYNGAVVIVNSDTPLVTSAMLRHLAENCQDPSDNSVVASVLLGTLDNPLNPVNYGKGIIDEETGDCLTIIEQKDIDKMIVLGGGRIIKDEAMGRVIERIYPECKTKRQRLALLKKGAARELANGRIITAQEADESKYWNSNMWGMRSPDIWRLFSSITSDNSSSEFYLPDIAIKAKEAGKRIKAYICDVKESRCLAGVNYPAQIEESNKFLRQRMAAENLEKLRQEAIDTFIKKYGYEPDGVVWAPSRICIDGEHIDYVGYFQSRVLTFASAEYGMFVAYAPRKDQTVRLASTLEGAQQEEFSLSDGPKDGRDWHRYLAKEVGVPLENWANYAKGAFYHLQNKQMRGLYGADIAVASNIQIAGGASSSSALTVADGYVARLANDIPIELNELADTSSEAETYSGTRGGKMDQATISLGLPDMALSIRFDPFNADPVEMPTGYEFVTFFTTKHAAGSQITSEYNERSAISRFVIPAILARLFEKRPDLEEKWSAFKEAIINSDLDTIETLRNYIEEEIIKRLPQRLTLTRIANEYPDAYDEIASDDAYKALFACKSKDGEENPTDKDVPLKVRDLCRHHVGEIIRVINAERLLAEAAQKQREGDNEACDAIMQQVGDIISQTDASLRDLYKISTPDIEEVMRIVMPKNPKERIPGVMGGRLMGGGFGGSVVAVVKNEAVNSLIQRVQEGYYKPTGRDGITENAINIHTPGTGATYEPVAKAAAAGAGAIGDAIEWHLEKPNLPYQQAIREVLEDIDNLGRVCEGLEIAVDEIKGITIEDSHSYADFDNLADHCSERCWMAYEVTIFLKEGQYKQLTAEVLRPESIDFSREARTQEIENDNRVYGRKELVERDIIPKRYLLAHHKRNGEDVVVKISEYVAHQPALISSVLALAKARKFWLNSAEDEANRFIPRNLGPADIHFFMMPDGRVDARIVRVSFADETSANELERHLYQLSKSLTTAGAAGGAIGMDGKQYEDVISEWTEAQLEDSRNRTGQLMAEIGQRAAARQDRPVSGDEAVAEARWLLDRLTYYGNCSDPLFSKNMPPHMKELPAIAEMLARESHAKISPELLIAAMLHDADRFFDGYYITREDTPAQESDLYQHYYKPIQHPRMAADFVKPLLVMLKIDPALIYKVEVIIRNHELGIKREWAEKAQGFSFAEDEWPRLARASRIIRDADSVSMFTPYLLTNSYRSLKDSGGEEEPVNGFYLKYSRVRPASRRVIDAVMRSRRAEFSAIPEGDAAYAAFQKAQIRFRAQNKTALVVYDNEAGQSVAQILDDIRFRTVETEKLAGVDLTDDQMMQLIAERRQRFDLVIVVLKNSNCIISGAGIDLSLPASSINDGRLRTEIERWL